MLELVIGVLAGAAVGAGSAYHFLTRKMKQQMGGLEQTSQQQLQQMRDEFAKEKMEMKKVHNRAYDGACADRAFRESQIDAMTNACNEFGAAETKEELCAALSHVLQTSFRADVAHFVSWNCEVWNESLLPEPEDVLLNFARDNFKSNEIFESMKPAIFGVRDVDSPLPDGFELDDQSLVYIPIAAHGRRFGIACAFFKADAMQTRLRVLRDVISMFSDTYYRIVRVNEEYNAARLDDLTGLLNGRAAIELLPPMMARASNDSPLALLFIECDNLAEIQEKYGHSVADEMIVELLQLMQTSARLEDLNTARPPDLYLRYDTSQFLLISEEADGTQALAVAQRIREAVDMKVDWPGGVPRWSVSIGIALAPEDSDQPRDLISKAEIALMYIKENNERNDAIRFDQVPRQFRISKLSGGVSGSLDVFEPSVTLQSMARAGGTGILTVTNSMGRIFWAFFDEGKLQKAYLEHYRADTAIVEFLSTFEDGSFDFREYDLLDAETLEEVHRMDETFNLRKSLERNLMDGVLAQDQLAEAKRLFPNTRLFVKPTLRYKEIVENLPVEKDPPSAREIEAMHMLCKYVNGRTMLCTILDKMTAYPTYLRWHAAALLVRREAVELTKLALSFTL